MIQQPLAVINGIMPWCHTVCVGPFGHNPAMPMGLRGGFPLISKVRHGVALYGPYEGQYAGRGPYRKYGRTLDDPAIPMPYLKRTTLEDHIQTNISQAAMWHQECAPLLNVVSMVTIHLKTPARAPGGGVVVT
jgi:hypothetical protein